MEVDFSADGLEDFAQFGERKAIYFEFGGRMSVEFIVDVYPEGVEQGFRVLALPDKSFMHG